MRSAALLTITIFQVFFSDFIYGEITYHGTEATLEKIMTLISQKEKGVYFRFGDGDLNVAKGDTFYDCEAHRPNRKLQQEMLEAYALNDPGVLKTLPVYNRNFGGLEPGMFPGNHETSDENSRLWIEQSKSIWGGEMTDVYSHVALHFSATSNRDLCFSFLNFLRNANCCLFVGNKNIPREVRKILFGTKCKFVPTPASNSYSQIDQIEKECLNYLSDIPEYKVVVVASGVAGRILQKRLWKKIDNIFIFDFGSLMDALCGWNTRYWIGLTKFEHKRFLNELNAYMESHRD